MFGYVICNKNLLSKEETDRYQKFYCGLCKAIEKKFGQLERFTLNFDMTFLALFLTALYEPEEKETEFRCPLHPIHKKTAIENEYLDYAADMSIALTYHKCRDDWEDEKKRSAKVYGRRLEKMYKEIRKKYPRQCEAIEKNMALSMEIEKNRPELVDEAVNCTGRMLAEVYVYKEDFWSESLRNFGYELGRFIYMMDAAMDYKEDKKKNHYNPLIVVGKKPEDAEDILGMMIGNATRQYEQLPIVQDAHLIENILYGGGWQKYYLKIKEKKDVNRSL